MSRRELAATRPVSRLLGTLLGTLIAVAVAAGGLSGCGVPLDDAPRALDPAEAPFQVLQDESASAPKGNDQAVLYFVRNDRVVRQTRRVEARADVAAVLDLLLEGPSPEQVEDGISSALPTTFTVEGVELGRNGVAVVTLGGSSTQISASPLAFAQVVATLTAPGLARGVRFRLDGDDLPVPRGDASVTEAPVDRRDYAELLAPAADGEPTGEPTGEPKSDPAAVQGGDAPGGERLLPSGAGSPAPG